MKPKFVLKIGGSLLDLPDLPQRLSNVLELFEPGPIVAVCGGGKSIDIIRAWDRVHDLGEEASHWIALEALRVPALFLDRIVERIRYTGTKEEFTSIWKQGRVPLYDAYRFIRDVDERSSEPLPRRWQVTSDSIAARIASTLGARELVLIKSATPAHGCSLAEAAQSGLVDEYFPEAARPLARVQVLNLRDPEAPPVELVGAG